MAARNVPAGWRRIHTCSHARESRSTHTGGVPKLFALAGYSSTDPKSTTSCGPRQRSDHRRMAPSRLAPKYLQPPCRQRHQNLGSSRRPDGRRSPTPGYGQTRSWSLAKNTALVQAVVRGSQRVQRRTASSFIRHSWVWGTEMCMSHVKHPGGANLRASSRAGQQAKVVVIQSSRTSPSRAPAERKKTTKHPSSRVCSKPPLDRFQLGLLQKRQPTWRNSNSASMRSRLPCVFLQPDQL